LKIRLLFAFLLGPALLCLGCSGPSEDQSPADSFLEDAEALQRGRLLFAGTCAGYCHKLTDQRSDAPYLFDCEWVHGGTDTEIYQTIVQGVKGTRMVAFGENFPEGPKDLWKIIAYLKSSRTGCG